MRGKFLYLLIAILLLLLVQPILLETHRGVMTLGALGLGVLFTAIYATTARRRWTWYGLALLLPAVAIHFGVHAPRPLWIQLTYHGSQILFLLLTAAAIVGVIIRAERVSADTIYGAVCVFLLCAIAFALAYSATALVQPQAFRGADGTYLHGMTGYTDPELFSTYVYYSLTTITTLGIGDIIPTTPIARALSSFEAVFGTIYLATLVGLLVGLYVVEASRKRERDSIRR